MVHPHRLAVADGCRGRRAAAILFDPDVAAAEFAVMAAFDLAAELLGHRHLAVADAEHRHARVEHRLRRARRAGLHHAGGAAGEDDRLRLVRGERGFGFVERHDLAIDAGFAHAARDELGHLRAEIDDEDGSCHVGIYRTGFRPVQRSVAARFHYAFRARIAVKKPSVPVEAARRGRIGPCPAAVRRRPIRARLRRPGRPRNPDALEEGRDAILVLATAGSSRSHRPAARRASHARAACASSVSCSRITSVEAFRRQPPAQFRLAPPGAGAAARRIDQNDIEVALPIRSRCG